MISGQTVYVESGVHVVGDFPIVESGLGVVVQSGIGVIGDFTATVDSGLGVMVQSGIGVVGDFTAEVSISGQPVTISGQPVVVGSGLNVVGTFNAEIASGLFVDGVSGVYVFVGSGLFVTADVEVEVASGLHVVQSKNVQLQDYFISDIDESDIGIKFYGYLDVEGSWYIMQDTSGTTYRYASSGFYSSNWIDRSGIIYQRFDQEF